MFDEELFKIENISDLTIEGNGSICQFNFDGKGINISNSTNITINNLIIDNNESYRSKSVSDESKVGRIEVVNSDNVLLNNIVIHKQKVDKNVGNTSQIQLTESTNCVISNSTLYSAQGEIINLRGCRNCIVSHNTTYNGWSGIGTEGIIKEDGISIENGWGNVIAYNSIYNASAAMITVNDYGTIVKNNIIKITEKNNGVYKGGPGIRFGHIVRDSDERTNCLTAKNCMAIDNFISNLVEKRDGKDSSDPYGIKLDWTQENIIIRGNTIINCKQGIQASNGLHKGIIEKNYISAIEKGIALYAKNDSINEFDIENNELHLSDGVTGIYLEWSGGNIKNNIVISDDQVSSSTVGLNTSINANIQLIVQNNILSMNGGIGIKNSAPSMPIGAVISDNTIKNPYYGIYLTNSIGTIIKNNKIVQSINNGIRLADWENDTIIKIKDNLLEGNQVSSYETAIYVLNSQGFVATDNQLTYLGSNSTPGYGIWLSGEKEGCLSENNIIFGYEYPINN